MKTRPVAAQLFLADTKIEERRYSYKDADCQFSNFCEEDS
jgi:hypothetical protein